MVQQAQQMPGRYVYTLDTITRSAPPMSGVYMLFCRGTCIYVGESDDVCAGLLEVYYEDNPCLNDKEITHFTFDLVPRESRQARHLERIREFRPCCNLWTGNTEAACSQCWLGQGLTAEQVHAIRGAPSPQPHAIRPG
jgi:hypothetical protein